MTVVYLCYSVHASYHRLELYEAEMAERTAQRKLESSEPEVADEVEGAAAEAPATEAPATEAPAAEAAAAQ